MDIFDSQLREMFQDNNDVRVSEIISCAYVQERCM